MECRTFIAVARCRYRFAFACLHLGFSVGEERLWQGERAHGCGRMHSRTPVGLVGIIVYGNWDSLELERRRDSKVQQTQGHQIAILQWDHHCVPLLCHCGSLVWSGQAVYVFEEVKTKVQPPPDDGLSLLGELGSLFSSVFHRKQKVAELSEATKELEENLIMNGKSLLAVPRQSQAH